MAKLYAGKVNREELTMDATPRPFTGAEFNLGEGLNASLHFRQEVPTFDLAHFTRFELKLESMPALGNTTIQLTTTLVQQ